MNRWVINRAGLFNFWYYDDLETFEFAEGKLLLRGSNGSGKSVTMQSLITVLLDGRTGAGRLDPFGSRARRMEDYLLGERELVQRDERTGYLFFEYRRDERFLTTGIGLKAARDSQMQFWGFTILDNRRIGIDFDLHRVENINGERETVPLSKRELEKQLGDGGRLVTNRESYAEMVNKYLFGFRDQRGFPDLIKLLIQLRSPKLSKDFKPSVIYEILNDSLSSLSQDELKPLTETIETIDETQQQCDKLERERKALLSLRVPYDRYNAHLLWEKADQLVRHERLLRDKQKLRLETEQKKQDDLLRHGALVQKAALLERELKTDEMRFRELEDNDIAKTERKRHQCAQDLETLAADGRRQEDKLARKQQQILQQEQRRRHLAAEDAQVRRDLEPRLLILAEKATHCVFLAEAEWRENYQPGVANSGLSALRQAAEQHLAFLDEVCLGWQQAEQKKEKRDAAHEAMEHSLILFEAANEKVHEQEATLRRLRQKLLDALDVWFEAAQPLLPFTATVILEMQHQAQRLYHEASWRDVTLPMEQIHEQRNQALILRELEIKHALQQLAEQLKAIQAELQDWQERREPEPPRHEATLAARTALRAAGVPFVPFYAAIDFHDAVAPAVRARIEAALADMGLLDALVVPELSRRTLAPHHDRILVTDGLSAPEGPSLASFCRPVLDGNHGVAVTEVAAILAAIRVFDAETLQADGPWLDSDGAYRNGLVLGHAPSVSAARFIGAAARRRYREQQIDRLIQALSVLQQQSDGYLAEQRELDATRRRLEALIASFPSDLALSQASEMQQKLLLESAILREDSDRKSKIYLAAREAWQTFLDSFDPLLQKLPLARTAEAWRVAATAGKTFLTNLQLLQIDDNRLATLIEQVEQVTQNLEALLIDQTQIEEELLLIHARREEMALQLQKLDAVLAQMGLADFRAELKRLRRRLDLLPKEIKAVERESHDAQHGIEQAQTTLTTLASELNLMEQLEGGWLTLFRDEAGLALVEYRERGQPPRPLVATLAEGDIRDWSRDTCLQAAKRLVDLLQPETDVPGETAQLQGNVSSRLTKVDAELLEYSPRLDIHIVADLPQAPADCSDHWRRIFDDVQRLARRQVLVCPLGGSTLTPYSLLAKVESNLTDLQEALTEEDRRLYQEVIANNIGRIITDRIRRTRHWVEEMSQTMGRIDSSSGVSFSLSWLPQPADGEDELDTADLVELLAKDPVWLTEDHQKKLATHFRARIKKAKTLVAERGGAQTAQQAIADMLDFRQWYHFQLYYRRNDKPKRKLSNNDFFKFSGGEKAMAMYIPLFSAICSRYGEAADDAPWLISLDEAFAGVDENNIREMFDLMEQFRFNYLINSQALWGDYETVKNLRICELVRPKDRPFVTVVRYLWNGRERVLESVPDAPTEAVSSTI